jgi:hypothetical protein
MEDSNLENYGTSVRHAFLFEMVQIGRRLWLRTAKGHYKLHNSGTVVVEVAYACFKDTFRKWTLLATVLLSKTTDVGCRRGQETNAQASRAAKPPSKIVVRRAGL